VGLFEATLLQYSIILLANYCCSQFWFTVCHLSKNATAPFIRQILFKCEVGITDTNDMGVTIPQAELLGRLLDVASLRHQVISQNLANVNTPGYRQLEVSFEDAFIRMLSKQGETAALHIAPRIVAGHDNPQRQDGNTVDLDKEIGSLNKNSILFNTAMQMLVSRVNMMRSAITGR
jgi:flagellar basal-body rod protein FlgB